MDNPAIVSNSRRSPEQSAARSYLTKPISTEEWLITFLIAGIPCVGIVMMFVWALSSDTNVNKRNFARAYLILVLILSALYFLFLVAVLASGARLPRLSR